MSQFIDQVKITVRSGDGGNGMVAWRQEKYEPMGGPFGGNGGRGGNVVFQASPDMGTLLDFRFRVSYEADHGAKGGSKRKAGKDAPDLVLKVPVGTVVYDARTRQIIADLSEPHQKAMVAQGGRGGRGNAELATPTKRAPAYCDPGEPGIERDLELELKLMADVGIIGLPNAGKSSLLSRLTAAHPKIAAYPFSTLEPNLGVVKRPEGDGYVLADIPGLIEGASTGIGLGHKFLRHIERTRLLVHLVDIAAVDPIADIGVINKELFLYERGLEKLPQLLVLNKADLLLEEEAQAIRDKLENNLGHPVYLISCATNLGLDSLKKLLLENLANLGPRFVRMEVAVDEKAFEHPDDGFEIIRTKKQFHIVGDRVVRHFNVTNLRDPESLFHFQKVLRAMGVIDALLQAGAIPGDEVVIDDTVFAFGADW